ncbi:MAG TPA: neutral/alkaline non-lysosomal ceramidase N-terminal domain-containing protein [Anaeromyxobacteraceae bacterium]|nr:neutral/alkaline non-lysosomal ceramidase N-terminal domain-containing protein [Anaeromyxobacteraceae bacterium]
MPLALPAEVPIGGFARLSYRSEPAHEPLHARALVLSEPGCAVALVSLEILLVPEALDRLVRERVADLRLDGVVVAATHTHAGPGGYWERAVGERLATGPFDPAVREAIVEAAADAIRKAAADRLPAELRTAVARDETLAVNRDGGAVDAHLVVARLARVDGHPIADVVAFPAHATLLGKGNRRISGDWPGALMDDGHATSLAGAMGVRLFFQGAVGDQSARPPPGTDGSPESYARSVEAAMAALRAPSDPDAAPRLAYSAATVPLPPVDPSAVPAWLRPAARTLAGGALPEEARAQAVRLGPLLLLAVPGEPVAAVGERLRAAAGDGAEVLSLAGGYVGYVETPERVRAGAGEARRTYYGPDLADRLGSAAVAAARAADGGGR